MPIVPEYLWQDKDARTSKNFDSAQGLPVFGGPYALLPLARIRADRAGVPGTPWLGWVSVHEPVRASRCPACQNCPLFHSKLL